jgi:hypothetical protein
MTLQRQAEEVNACDPEPTNGANAGEARMNLGCVEQS